MALKTKPHIARSWAVWVIQAPYPGGYAHREAVVTPELETTWQAWQQMFSLGQLTILGSGFPYVGDSDPTAAVGTIPSSPLPVTPSPHLPVTPSPRSVSESSHRHPVTPSPPPPRSYSSQLMLQLGTLLYRWLFDGPIETTLAQSTGIAAGRDQPLQVRLDVRDPDLIAIPWEIMQPRPGKPAISLNPQLRFSRTTTDVEPLSTPHKAQGLNILLVLGSTTPTPIDPTLPSPAPKGAAGDLQLETEAATLSQVLQESSQNPVDAKSIPVSCLVDTLIEPTASELITYLETGKYNIFFYAGHGVPAPDGGMLLLGADRTLSGTELAAVLTNGGVTLAVFNSCWGAQPFESPEERGNNASGKYLPRSSLAEVLIHHGVPAVLAMRDEIADREALTFIQAFARAIATRVGIDRAVAIARQVLLATYKFNQPAWSLPVLYMHPEFDGSLLEPPELLATELPENSLTRQGFAHGKAFLQPVAESYGALEQESRGALVRGSRGVGEQGRRGAGEQGSRGLPVTQSPLEGWEISGGRFRVGRRDDNDLVLSERWVSQQHAEIFCRDLSASDGGLTYFLRDFSRYGTLIFQDNRWQKVHHQEVPLKSGVLLKFGSSQGQALAFIVEFSMPNGTIAAPPPSQGES